MKKTKLIIFLFCLLVIVGCSEKNNDDEESQKNESPIEESVNDSNKEEIKDKEQTSEESDNNEESVNNTVVENTTEEKVVKEESNTENKSNINQKDNSNSTQNNKNKKDNSNSNSAQNNKDNKKDNSTKDKSKDDQSKNDKNDVNQKEKNKKSENNNDNSKNKTDNSKNYKYDYGVFIGYDGKLSALSDYKTIVIDAQYVTKKEITSFKKQGHTVYTYINVGSIENFRPYYDEYKSLSLGVYEHWEDENWVDVSSKKWQNFILNKLAPELVNKGVDGFFVDNTDVYYVYPKKEIMNGLAKILKGLKGKGKKVVINGGDSFLDAYTSKGGKWSDVITGINQESVFSSIEWDTNTFGKASKEDHEYFKDYLEKYGSLGAEIYLLEYTTDKNLIKQIKKYSIEKGFHYYISDSLALD